MLPSCPRQLTTLPDAEARGPSANPSPTRPPLSANSLKIPAASLQTAQTTKSHPLSNLQIRQSLCPGTTAASSAPCVSSHDRPSSPAHRRSTPPSRPCARTRQLSHALCRASAHYFG